VTDPNKVETSYEGDHTHAPPPQAKGVVSGNKMAPADPSYEAAKKHRHDAATAAAVARRAAGAFSWVPLRARWVTLRARWVPLRARWVPHRARWVPLRARWVTLRARWVTLRARWVPLRARWVPLRARWVPL
jgi:hypothetical protein